MSVYIIFPRYHSRRERWRLFRRLNLMVSRRETSSRAGSLGRRDKSSPSFCGKQLKIQRRDYRVFREDAWKNAPAHASARNFVPLMQSDSRNFKEDRETARRHSFSTIIINDSAVIINDYFYQCDRNDGLKKKRRVGRAIHRVNF